MASVIEEDETEYYIKCSVCYTNYDDQRTKPKQLPCSHTVCIECLKEIIRNGIIVCPVCRSENPCLHGVDQLHTNNDVLHIIKLKEQLQSYKYAALTEYLGVETLVDELVKNYSPYHRSFFEHLLRIMQFIAKDATRSLEFIWKLQDDWSDDELVGKLQQIVISFTPDLAPEQMDYLISDINARWSSRADNIAKRHLLDFTFKLAKETNHECVLAEILDMIGGFIWCPDTPLELEDFCIDVFKKILTHQWRNNSVIHWVFECINRIQQRQRTVSAMKLLRQLCYMYAVKAAAFNEHYQAPSEFKQLVQLKYEGIYTALDQEWKLFDATTEDLMFYMGSVRYIVQQNVEMVNRSHNHEIQVRERLVFLQAFIKYGRKVIDVATAQDIWISLVNRGVFETDWNTCFEWFTKIELTPAVTRCIFYQHVLKLNPLQMTSAAMDCFEHLFRAVEYGEGDSILDEINPRPAIEFLWKVVQQGKDSAKQKAYPLLKETIEYLGPRLVLDFQQLENCGDEIGKYLVSLVEGALERKTSRNVTELLNYLAEMLDRRQIEIQSSKSDQEDTSQQILPTVELQRFSVIRTHNFILSVMKRGRLLGQIHIKPSPDFVSGKFMQELVKFSFCNDRKVGRRVTKACDTFVSLKIKNAMFQPVVPELLSYRVWLDSERLQNACQVGITTIESSKESRVTGFQFVFLLRDEVGSSSRVKPSLLFGEVIQGIDVVKSLSSRPQVCWKSEGLRFSLKCI